MEVLCAGLSKTGTTSIHHALQRLGYTSLHYDQNRLFNVLSGRESEPDFRIYDDYQAVSDVPSAYFFRELAEAYPRCKIVLTVRDADSWYESIRKHFSERSPISRPRAVQRMLSFAGNRHARQRMRDYEFRTNLRNLCYGSVEPREYAYKAKYFDHNNAVRNCIPAERLLVMNLAMGDGWEKLCPFLNKPIPEVAFPVSNRAGEKFDRKQRVSRHLYSFSH